MADGAVVTGMFEGASLGKPTGVLMAVGTNVGISEGSCDGDREVANADGRADGVVDGITERVGRNEGMVVDTELVGTAVKAVVTDDGTDVTVVVGERDGLADKTIADGGTLVCAVDDGNAVGIGVGVITSTTLIPTILPSEIFKTCDIDIFHES